MRKLFSFYFLGEKEKWVWKSQKKNGPFPSSFRTRERHYKKCFVGSTGESRHSLVVVNRDGVYWAKRMRRRRCFGFNMLVYDDPDFITASSAWALHENMG